MKSIHQKFDRAFPPGQLQQWHQKKLAGHLALEFSCRYLTPKKFGQEFKPVTIPKDVDPNDILSSLHIGTYLPDNVVSYHRRATDHDGLHRYVPIYVQCYDV